jgi:hypothetical protein
LGVLKAQQGILDGADYHHVVVARGVGDFRRNKRGALYLHSVLGENMSMVEINWRPSQKELRKFGVTVIIGFGVIGLIFQFIAGNINSAYISYITGAILGIPALTGTVIALPCYWVWMGVAFVMGNIVSRLLLGLFFFIIITPMGTIRRMFNDKLRLRRPDTTSNWNDLPQDGGRGHFERQF